MSAVCSVYAVGIEQVLAEVASGSDETFTDEEVELFIWLFDASMDTEIEWSHFQTVIQKAKGPCSLPARPPARPPAPAVRYR
jgi:hypothetical protein